MNYIISKRIVFIFLIIYGFFNFINRGILQAVRGRKSDLSSYYTAAIVLKNKQNPYDTDLMLETGIKHNSYTLIAGHPRVHKYVYPPVLATAISPLTVFSFNQAKIIWTVIINTIIILLIVIYTKKYTGSNLKTSFLFFLLMTFNPLYETIAFGQINIILLLLILLSLFYYTKNNIVVASFFLTAGIFTKILPVVLLLFFLFFKEYRFIIWTILFSGLFILLQLFMNGYDVTSQYFLQTLPAFSRGAGVSIANHSFYSFLQFVFSNGIIINILFYTVIVAVLIYSVKIKDKRKYFVVNIILLHLLPKTVWEHHYLILYIIPLILVSRKDFSFSTFVFFILTLFWAVFSIDYNFYSRILNETFLIFLRYIKVYAFLFFTFFYLKFAK